MRVRVRGLLCARARAHARARACVRVRVRCAYACASHLEDFARGLDLVGGVEERAEHAVERHVARVDAQTLFERLRRARARGKGVGGCLPSKVSMGSGCVLESGDGTGGGRSAKSEGTRAKGQGQEVGRATQSNTRRTKDVRAGRREKERRRSAHLLKIGQHVSNGAGLRLLASTGACASPHSGQQPRCKLESDIVKSRSSSRVQEAARRELRVPAARP
eukprot:4654737-Pleurochrysis_carterae.AAC.1